MAYQEIETTDNLPQGRVKINGAFKEASEIYEGESCFVQNPILIEGNGCGNFDIINIGNPGFVPQGTETRNLVPAGILRIGGNILLTRNLLWNTANLRWETAYEETDAYGSGMLEMGGEGINMQVSPPGEQFYDNNGERMIFSFRQSDARGVPGYEAGPVNHCMAPFFAHYATDAYQASKLRSWVPSTATEPLVHLHSDELKGTSGTFDQNEYLRLETNCSTTTAWPAMTFKMSSGNYDTRTVIVTNRTVGEIGSIVYDGAADQKTAQIQFITRGTISSGNAGQSIKFNTSPTNTAGLLVRMELTNDGAIKNYAPWRFEYPSITTVPDYTAFITTPVMTSGSVGNIQQASGSTGGLRFFGFSTTSTAATAVGLFFTGVLGATAPTAPAIVFNAAKHNGSTNIADVAATEIVCQYRNNATNLETKLGNGNTGFLLTGPTAVVHIAASTTARASLCLNPGAAPTSPVNGDMWIDSTAHTIHVRINGVTKTFTLT